jgi:DNA-binding response OmpR family regulator
MRKGLQMNYILLVEDDTMIASGIIYALEMEGYEVCHAVTVAVNPEGPS